MLNERFLFIYFSVKGNEKEKCNTTLLNSGPSGSHRACLELTREKMLHVHIHGHRRIAASFLRAT